MDKLNEMTENAEAIETTDAAEAIEVTDAVKAVEAAEIKSVAEEPLFEARTVYDTDRFMRFNITHFLKNTVLIIFMSAMVIFATVCAVFMLAVSGYDQTSVTVLIVEWGIVLVYVLSVFVIPRFTYKNSPNYNSTHHIEFFSDKIVIHSEGRTMSDMTNLRYEGITEVRESETDIYIYISMNQAHIVGKDCFIIGDGERLKAYLYSKVDPKIYKCK